MKGIEEPVLRNNKIQHQLLLQEGLRQPCWSQKESTFSKGWVRQEQTYSDASVPKARPKFAL